MSTIVSTPVSSFRFIDLDPAAVFVSVAYFFDALYNFVVSCLSNFFLDSSASWLLEWQSCDSEIACRTGM